jgi:predicted RNase H-like nuclease (RuvC/YqgF family)
MSNTEPNQGAGTGAADVQHVEQTAPPEQKTAGDAPRHDDEAHTSDQSDGSEADKGLTDEQRTIRKQMRRIERLTAKRGAAEREAELLRQQMAEFQRRTSGQLGEDGEPAMSRQISEADIERVASQRAAEIAQQRAIGEKVSKVLREGSKLEGFNAAVDAVAEVVPFTDRKGKPTPFIEAVLDADDPAALLKYLGDNSDEAEELADLSPAQLGRRIAKLEDRLASVKKKSSAAPVPIKPVGGTSKVTPDESKLSDAEWRAQRFKRG